MRFAYMAAAIARLHERAAERSQHFTTKATGGGRQEDFRRAAYYAQIAEHLQAALLAAREAAQ